jgi:hypothetical protein
MRAFRHLRDCDAALHLIGASPQSPLSLDFTRYPFPSGMAENRIKRRDYHHDHVRGGLSLTEIK